ncbi:putative PurR-regulated permease PerM [Cyclonatronum proteinivorum]|uniref:Putative PurR-regulated permease PerM n=1 Tax=Cyclonatronum proteinivorum TaxID=1457365 RepID=A0A345UMZ6_9BACT|nr:AI-2E family transporter [Cyclonatronum proteinivorum]AXJ01848.1 putative PurR-regulated permease PerM [Cyclonatronum proteinivorum]
MLNFTPEKVFRFLFYTAIGVTVAMVLWRFSGLLVYLLLSLVLSYILNPVVNRMQANGMHRTLATFLVVLSVLLILIWASTTIIPNIGNQLLRLTAQLNVETVAFIARSIEDYTLQLIPQLPQGYLTDNVNSFFDRFFDLDNVQALFGNIIGVFTNLFTALLILPFTTFFLLKDGSKLRRQILQLVPNKYFETTVNIISQIEMRLGRHFKAVGLQSTLVAFFSWMLLSVAGLNNALSVGVAIGLANTIPYFGPVLGYLLSIVIAIIETGDFSLVLNCILAVMIVQIMDNVIFYPAIFSRSANIHPLYVLLIILIGAELAGLIGMLVAIPLFTVIRVIYNEISWSIQNYYVFKSRQT